MQSQSLPCAGELLRQVAALEASGEGERDRRREVEAALQVRRAFTLSLQHNQLLCCLLRTCSCIDLVPISMCITKICRRPPRSSSASCPTRTSSWSCCARRSGELDLGRWQGIK